MGYAPTGLPGGAAQLTVNEGEQGMLVPSGSSAIHNFFLVCAQYAFHGNFHSLLLSSS